MRTSPLNCQIARINVVNSLRWQCSHQHTTAFRVHFFRLQSHARVCTNMFWTPAVDIRHCHPCQLPSKQTRLELIGPCFVCLDGSWQEWQWRISTAGVQNMFVHTLAWLCNRKKCTRNAVVCWCLTNAHKPPPLPNRKNKRCSLVGMTMFAYLTFVLCYRKSEHIRMTSE